LASYGTVARSIVQNLLNNDGEKLQSIEVRFTGHVFPGENLEIKVWKEQNKLFFEAEVVERKTKALVGVITVREAAKL
jgi:acyl dehydratase